MLHDGIVYFGAGIWSGYGVGIYALDARSGQLVWSNTDSNRIAKANMDHGVAHEAGLTPQGYLAVVHGMLVVPCGAQLPAFLDLKTGKLGTYTMGWGGRNRLPKGTWFVAGSLNYLSHGGDLYDVARPNDERFPKPPKGTDFKAMLYAGGFTRLRVDPTNQKDLGEFDEPVFASNVMYHNDRGVVASDLAEAKREERSPAELAKSHPDDPYPDKWTATFRTLWRLPSKLKVHIHAGPHLYLAGPGVIEAVRLPPAGESPKVVWRAAIEGTPHRLLAAAGKLFVVTREGSLYAFGAEPKAPPVVHALPTAPAGSADAWTTTAADLLRTTKVREGYALVIGAGSGRLVEEIVRQSRLDAIVFERDPVKVARLRERLHRAGWYGVRASVYEGDALAAPLPPYLASLVVSEDWSTVGAPADRSLITALFPRLRPYGGSLCLPAPLADQERLVEDVPRSGLVGAAARVLGRWVVVSREGPLSGAAPWSHEAADAANTGASSEQFLKAPFELLWFDTPPRWIRIPGATLVRVGGGRMFLKANHLSAVDVYTGKRLWEAELPFGHKQTDQMVLADDALYVAGGRTCVAIDPATGRKTAQFDLPDDLAGPWLNLRACQGRLAGQSGKHLVCVDRHSGRLAWKHEGARANLSVAVGGGKVFCSERTVKRWGATADRDAKARAFDLASGKVLWEIAGGSEVRYSAPLDAVVLSSGAYRAADGTLLAALPDEGPKPGSKLSAESLPKPLFVLGAKLLFGTAESYVEYDLRTGKPAGDAMRWTRRGCTIPRASAHLVTTRCLGNAACIDLASRQIVLFWNVRAACSNNLFPADGVLNMPSLTGGCTCNYLPVSQAFVPAEVIATPPTRAAASPAGSRQ